MSYTEISQDYIDIATLNPFRYRGYYYDTESGLYYLNSRYYDPETGRFINTDDVTVLSTLSEELNGINLYAYCFNNPVNDIDENGCWSWKKFWKAVAIVVVVVAVIAVTVVTAGSGSLIGAAIIAGTVAAGANIFNQAVIQNKSFGEVDWIDVGISFISTSLSALIPGSSFSSILLQSFTSASITSILNKIFYNESVNLGEVAFNTFINLGASYVTIGLDKVTNRFLGKLVTSKIIKGSVSERLGLYNDTSFGFHLINEFFVNLFITRNGG